MKYKIIVKVSQDKIFTYNTDSYTIEDGVLLCFKDHIKNEIKKFPLIICEITEYLKNEDNNG
jgi:hypothetical protein